MIPRKYKGDYLKGKKVIINYDMRNGGGQGVSAGTVATIVSVVRGRGITIQTDKCQHCGQYAYITGVPRERLSLIEE